MLHQILHRINSFTCTFVKGALALAIVASIGCTKKENAGESVLRGYVAQNVKGLDPAHASDLYTNTVLLALNDTLLGYHYLKRPVEVVPLIAESMPEVSKDGLTHTFKIRKGVKFHDDEAFPGGKGRDVTAQDFIYSWKRLADPATKSDGFWIFDGRIVGLNEWRDKMAKKDPATNYDTPVAGLSAPDDQTLVIKLIKPFYQLHYVLTMNYAAPVPKEGVEKYGAEFLNHPIGTGPYKLAKWVRNSQIEMVKNEAYNGPAYPSDGSAEDKANGLLDDAGKKPPFADKLVIYEIIEDQTLWLKFLKGEIDYSAIPKDNFDSAVKDKKLLPEFANKGIVLTIENEPDVTYNAFNMVDPVLGKNKELRKAIAHAIDVDTMIKTFYNDRAIRAQSPIPPGLDGYDPSFKNPHSVYDVAKAKEFMAKAGFPEGKGLKEIEYSTVTSGTSRQLAEFIQQNLAAIGVKLKIIQTTWPQFTEKINQKKAQMWGIAWSADYPDAENFLQLLFGPNEAPGANGANFKNAKFDELYKKAALLPPGPARTAIYKQMRDIFVEEMPWTLGVHRESYSLKHGWVGNYKRHPITGTNLRFLKVDSKKREELKKNL